MDNELYDELGVVPTKKYSRDSNDRKNREAKMMADKDISKHYYKQYSPAFFARLYLNLICVVF